jgi:hypothetical protein
MKFALILAAVLLSACAQFGKVSGSAMNDPQVGSYCEAPVAGACLGCNISCPAGASPRASCRAGAMTANVCTRGAVCECR